MIQEILNHQQIEQKINRLAHQIIENTFDEAVIYIGGISGNGLKLAELLRTVLLVHTTQQIIPFHITMNKEEPVNHPITLSIPADHTKDACIILVDDVLNSGKTMQYALGKLLEQPVRMIKTVALVDRKHRRFPIKADFVGISLSTTLKERVEVTFEEGAFRAQLQ